MKEYRWATLGCGVIANQLAEALAKQGRTLYAVGNRTYEKAIAFAQKYHVKKVYNVIEDMFTDDNVDIIYISTPHNTHISYIIQALKNGKHVLCEKSITLNAQELQQAVKLAEQNDVILAEAMTIYHMPIYQKLNEIIQSDILGKPRFIQVNFGSYKEYDMKNRFFNKNLAGGALLDIGVYALSFARWFFSQNPCHIMSQVKFAPTGVDEQAGILLMNEKQEMATISLSLHAKQPKRGIAAFEKGYIEMEDYPRAEQATIYYTEQNKKEIIKMGKTEYALLYEVMDMEKAVSKQENVMYLQYSIDVMEQMTKLRKQWGLKYPEEE